MIRVVIDPGVFVSAAIGARGNAPDLVLRAFIADHIEVIASPMLLEELERVLTRPKFAVYLNEPAAREFVDRIRRHARVVEDVPDPPPVVRDRGDDYLVALAGRERVDAIVSGDRDLVDADLSDLQVWTPRELMQRL